MVQQARSRFILRRIYIYVECNLFYRGLVGSVLYSGEREWLACLDIICRSALSHLCDRLPQVEYDKPGASTQYVQFPAP